MTTKAMQRAADMASVMGIEQDGYGGNHRRGKGNYTMMDNLGVKMDDTSIKAYALANGFKGTWKEASNTEKSTVCNGNVFRHNRAVRRKLRERSIFYDIGFSRHFKSIG